MNYDFGFEQNITFLSACGPRYMREIGTPKNRLKYNEFAYEKTKDNCKLEDRF